MNFHSDFLRFQFFRGRRHAAPGQWVHKFNFVLRLDGYLFITKSLELELQSTLQLTGHILTLFIIHALSLSLSHSRWTPKVLHVFACITEAIFVHVRWLHKYWIFSLSVGILVSYDFEMVNRISDKRKKNNKKNLFSSLGQMEENRRQANISTKHLHILVLVLVYYINYSKSSISNSLIKSWAEPVSVIMINNSHALCILWQHINNNEEATLPLSSGALVLLCHALV